MKRIIVSLFIIAITAGLSSCSTFRSNEPLVAQTKMSSTIILPTIPTSQKTVLISSKNMSQYSKLNLDKLIKTQLKQKGYTITTKPNQAHYILQLNIIQSGRTLANYYKMLLMKGFNPKLMNPDAIIIPLPLTKDNTALQIVVTSMIIDIQISERIISSDQNKQPIITWNRYETRVGSQINVPNTNFNRAKPLLMQSIAKTISNLF